MDNLGQLILVTFLAAVLADVSMVFGVIPFYFLQALKARTEGLFAAVAAGMMMAASLVQLVGAGLDRTPGLQGWEVAAGVGAGAFLYLFVSRWLDRHQEFDVMSLRRSGGRQALLIVMAMTVHSAPEGVAIGVAFGSRELGLGLAVVSALAVHNIPEAIAITLALRAQGLSVNRCLGWALLTSLPQPIFAPLAAWLIWLFEPLLPAGMGFAAGAMVFLVIDDLLPESFRKAPKETVAIGLTAGVILMIALGRLVGL
ncbi:MAG: ZIP family metal transporter [Opitutales bacterium]